MRAKKSIFLVIFSLHDPSIITLLQERAKEGIDVVVIYDAKHGLKKKLGKNICAIPRKCSGLMHRKILIIDNEEIWLGSSNFTTASLRMHDNLMIAFTSKEIAELLISHEKIERPLEKHEFLLGNQAAELWLLPEDRDAEERLIKMIDGAKKTIKVAMFTWTNPKLTKAIVNAHKRNISVEVVVEKTNSENILKILNQNGVISSHSSKNVLLHHKFAYIDDQTLVLGSANWTRSAFNKNSDCFMILHDLNDAQKAYMDKLWKHIKREAA